MKDKIHQLLQSGGPTNVELAYQLAKSQNLTTDCYYLIRFGDMLQYLRSFENIEIINFDFYAPNLEEIAKIEAETCKPLDAGVRRFYEQCNGLFLYWLDKRNESIDNLRSSDYPDYGVDGYIDIRGIYDIYHRDNLDSFGYGHDLIHRELSSEEVESTHHMFDYFSVYNDMMAYTGAEFNGNPLLIMGDDHQACYTDARLIQIPAYLELVFHVCGAVEGRRRMLKKYNGHKLPILTPDKAYFDQYKLPDFNEYPAVFEFPESGYWN
jgi:hypothetical protein